jgi:hypothetical protein
MTARSAATAAGIAYPEVAGRRRPRHHFIARWYTATRRVFASAKHLAESLVDRLRARVVAWVRQTTRAPRQFAATVVAGIVAGATAAVCGPLTGAAVGGVAGFVAALKRTPRG